MTRPMSKLILFGGKGGVGKTTTSAATAVWAAEHGFKTLIVSSDPAHSTSDSFEQEIGKEPTPINGVENLYAMEINPEEELTEFLPDLGASMERPLKLMGIDDLDVKQEDLLFPGLDEALAFDKLLTYVESPYYDLIVFDTAPTGHTLRFLSLPELLDSWLVKVLKFKVQIARVKNLITGKKDTSLEDIKKLKKRVEHVRRVLQNKDIASFNIVTIPEQMGIMESKRAMEQIREYGIHVHSIIINHIFPEDSDCGFCKARRRVQNKYIKMAKQLAKEQDLEMAQLTIMKEEVKGVKMLKKIGWELYGREQIHLELTETMHISEHDDRIEIVIQLPSTISKEIDLRSDGEDLVMDINGLVNRVTLSQCIEDLPIHAAFTEDTLTITIDLTDGKGNCAPKKKS
jgi:arsenite/tail-anchored protein-transporting ATPase